MSDRVSKSWHVIIGGSLKLSVWVAECPAGSPVEVRLNGARGLARSLEPMLLCFGEAISLGLVQGVPIRHYVKVFKGRMDETGGTVQGDPFVTECRSIVDYVARALDARYPAP